MNKEQSLQLVKDWIKQSGEYRTKIEPSWQRGYQIFMGAHRVAMTFKGVSYYPSVNQTAAIIEQKNAVLNSAPVLPLVVPRDNNEPTEWYLTRTGMKKAEGDPNIPADMRAGKEPVPDEAVQVALQNGYTEDDFVEVSDELAADVMTKELQSEWALDNADEWLVRNNKDKLIFGHSDALVQWDSTLQRLCIIGLDPYEVWVSPGSDTMSRASWVVVRTFLSKEECKVQWPELSDQIDKMPSGMYSSCVVNTQNRNESIEGQIEIIHAFQRKYKEDKKVGIRQIVVVGGIVESDGMSDYPDIPVMRNLHYLRPLSCYGIGEPEMLADLQDFINRLWGMIHDLTAQHRGPLLATANSVLESMKAELKGSIREANTTIGVDDDLFERMGGKLFESIVPAQIEGALRQLIADLSQTMDRLSGMTNAARGELLAGSSGVAMERATTNAQESVAQSARQTEMALRYGLRVAVDMILEYLPAEVMHDRNRRFSVEAIEAMRRRVKQVGYDLRVQVTAGDADASEFDRLTRAAQTAQNLWSVPEFVDAVIQRLNMKDGSKIAKRIAAQMQAMQQKPQVQQPTPEVPEAPAPPQATPDEMLQLAASTPTE